MKDMDEVILNNFYFNKLFDNNFVIKIVWILNLTYVQNEFYSQHLLFSINRTGHKSSSQF